jgi:methionyl-tRNA synthetase
MPETPKKFYLTTPIYYVNARPHIGHAYSTIAADVIARRHRLLGDDTFFLTGTDEHGQKVQRSAEAAGIPPQQFADQVSKSFADLWKRMGITNDDYIRTTDERHKRGVQKLWHDLEARGAIYLSTYTGQYSVGEEMFVEGPPGAIGPDGKPTETVTEENYFFRLSDYQQPIIDLIESGQLHIQPETVRNEVLSFVRGGLKDLSISRTTFDWGIKVPGNDKHVVYVWLDALANYMTAVGYGSDNSVDRAKFERYWPADLHLVGKEITRFHCVYWPAFLMALNPKLQHGRDEPTPQLTPAEHAEWAAKWVPKSVVANGWLLFEESKMSKSRGNVVRTETILDAFGPLCPPVPNTPSALLKGTASAVPSDAPHNHAALVAEGAPAAADALGSSSGLQPAELTPKDGGALAPGLAAPTKAQQDLFASDVIRYFLLREIPFGQDGSFSFDALITRYNADLANGYGNLVRRTLSMVGRVPKPLTRAVGEFPDLAQNYLFSYLSGPGKFAFANETDKEHYQLRFSAGPLENGIRGAFDNYDLTRVTEDISWAISATDSHLSSNAPWKMPDGAERDDVIYTAAESIRIITALLYPVMPYATASVWRQLGIGDIEEAARNGELKNLQWGGLKPGTKLGPLAPIFPRADKGLPQIMTDMENPTTPSAESGKASESVPADDFSAVRPAAVGPVPTTTDPASSVPTAESLNAVSPATDEQVAPTAVPPIAPTITIDDFVKIDLRVAQIVVAERIPKADKLLRLEVDLGYEKRQILSGIAEFYTPEELIGRRIAIIANLAPRKMRGLESHGMLLAASGENHSSKPILATFSDEIPLGSKIR